MNAHAKIRHATTAKEVMTFGDFRLNRFSSRDFGEREEEGAAVACALVERLCVLPISALYNAARGAFSDEALEGSLPANCLVNERSAFAFAYERFRSENSDVLGLCEVLSAWEALRESVRRVLFASGDLVFLRVLTSEANR